MRLAIGRVEATLRAGVGSWRLFALGVFSFFVVQPAAAVVIELKDVASDRVERQRAEAIGLLPLPGTPNVGQLAERLAAKKMAMGNPILIRVFKASSELEVWLQNGETYELFATYPICNWSGTLGPKLNEGDKQSPEGVYTVTSRQLHLVGRHPRSLNLGFPNALDRQMNRTGSYILIHGGCSSVGCFAMTNPVIEEVYSLAFAALSKGKQDAFQVQVFPFRMTEDRLKAYASNEWYDFWRNLKDVSDNFEQTHLPPRITICEGRYWVEDNGKQQEVASQGPLAVCAASQVEAASANAPVDASPVLVRWWPLSPMVPPALVRSLASAPMARSRNGQLQLAARLSSQYSGSNPLQKSVSVSFAKTTMRNGQLVKFGPSDVAAIDPNQSPKRLPASMIPCSQTRSSCRHWIATAGARMQAKQLLSSSQQVHRGRRKS